MSTFDELKLSNPLRNAIDELGFETPTPIQSQSFTVIRSGKDVVGIAQGRGAGEYKAQGFESPESRGGPCFEGGGRSNPRSLSGSSEQRTQSDYCALGGGAGRSFEARERGGQKAE